MYGYEYLSELVEIAKVRYPNVKFIQSDVLDRNSIQKQRYDFITFLGVLSLFDEVEPVLNNLIYWTKTNGAIYIHTMFNPYDIDIILRYRKAEDYTKDIWEYGWNIVSQKTISRILDKNKKVQSYKFHKFEISVDLDKHFDDPVRSWTEKLENGKRQIINGLCIKQPQYILEICC